MAESGEIYTYHFNILRNILEKTATFHGFRHFSACLKQDQRRPGRHPLMPVWSNCSATATIRSMSRRKCCRRTRNISAGYCGDFMNNYRFNPELFPEPTQESVNA